MVRTLAALTTLLVAASLPAADVVVSPDTVDRIANTARQRWQSPGLAFVVVHDDKVIVLKGYGTNRVDGKEPVTPDTVFPLASCTKAFTTTLLAMLVDEEKLAWDDPVRKHLPTFRLSDPRADALVSLRDLVSHRTGVPGNDLLWYRAPWDLNDVLRRSAHLPLAAPFRGAYQYNSINFLAAGRAAANRGRAEWDELVKERICDPLGMTNIAFTSESAAKFPNRAAGHQRSANGRIVSMPEYVIREPNPSGSLFASARDLGAWLRFHLANGEFNGKRLVSATALGETTSPQIVMPWNPEMRTVYPASKLVNYAMGWVVYDHRGELVVAHGGVIDGFRAQITLLPERKLGFALLNNLHETKMNIAIGNAIIDHALQLEPRDWNAHFLRVEVDERKAKSAAITARNQSRLPNTTPTLPLLGYVGEYTDAAYGTGTVSIENDRLLWKWSSFREPLGHFQHDTFRVPSGYFAEELLTFRVGNGVVSEVEFKGVRYLRSKPVTPRTPN